MPVFWKVVVGQNVQTCDESRRPDRNDIKAPRFLPNDIVKSLIDSQRQLLRGITKTSKVLRMGRARFSTIPSLISRMSKETTNS